MKYIINSHIYSDKLAINKASNLLKLFNQFLTEEANGLGLM